MKRLSLLFVFGVVLSHVFTVCAEDRVTTIRLITSEWPGYTNKDGTGLYFDVLKAVYEPEGIQIKFELVPWKRAQAMVKKTADAIVGETIMPEEDYLYPKWPIDVEEVTAIFKKAKVAEWKGEASLENKTVSWIRGYDFQMYLHVNLKVLEVDSVQSGLLMLDKDRMDFLIDYIDGIEEEAQNIQKTVDHNFDLAQYQMEPLRLGAKVYVAFVNSARGKKLVEIFDRRMAQLYESGVLDTMYKNFTQWHYDQYPK
jgi:polar amino acid transport system substrate-binding protein